MCRMKFAAVKNKTKKLLLTMIPISSTCILHNNSPKLVESFFFFFKFSVTCIIVHVFDVNFKILRVRCFGSLFIFYFCAPRLKQTLREFSTDYSSCV